MSWSVPSGVLKSRHRSRARGHAAVAGCADSARAAPAKATGSSSCTATELRSSSRPPAETGTAVPGSCRCRMRPHRFADGEDAPWQAV